MADLSSYINIAANTVTTGNLSATGNVTSNSVVSTTGNITGNYILGNGSQLTGLSATYGNSNVATFLAAFGSNAVSTTGNITTGNLVTGGSGGNIFGANNISANTFTALGNINGGALFITGNANVQGTLTYNNLTNITTANLVFGLGNTQTGINVNGAGFVVGNTNEASFLYNYTTQAWNSNIGISAVGNVAGGNLRTTGLISATGNVTAGNVSATNVTGTLATAAQTNITSVGTLGALTVTANVTGGNVLTGGLVSAAGNVTGAYILGNGSQLTGLPATYTDSNVTTLLSALGSNVISGTGNITTTANISGGYILGNGSQLTGLPATYTDSNVTTLLNAFGSNTVSTSGNVTAGYFAGNGSALTSVAGANVSGTVANATYALTSNAATYSTQATYAGTANAVAGANVAGTVANATYATSAGSAATATTAGTVTTNAQPNITSVGILSSASVSGNVTGGNISIVGGTLAFANSSVVQSNPLDLSINGAYQISVKPAGGSYQWTFGNDGALTGPTGVGAIGYVSAGGNVTGGNILTAGLVSATGNVTAGGLTVNGTGVVTGNLQVQGTLTYNNLTNITTPNLVFGLANTSTGITANGAGFVVGNTSEASFLYNYSAQAWNSNIGISAVGNIAGNYIIGNGSQLTGVTAYTNANVSTFLAAFGANTISTTGNITGGNIDLSYMGGAAKGNVTGGNVSMSGNITGGNVATGGLITATGSITTGGSVSATGTVTGANLATGGTVSATANITGGNVVTGGVVSSAGNITAGNLRTGGSVSATGSLTGGNIFTAGNVSATGNVTSANILASATISTGGNIFAGTGITAVGTVSGSNLNITGLISATGNTTAGNVLTTGQVSATGNITGGNIATAGQVSATGNITTANSFVGNLVGTTVSITGNVSAGNVIVNGQSTTYGVVTPAYMVVGLASSIASFGLGSTVIFDTVVGNANSQTSYNASTGVFTLTAGVTYDMSFTPSFITFSNTTSGYMCYEWVDATTNTPLDSTGTGIGTTIPMTETSGQNDNATARVIYTPSTNKTVKLRVTGASGTVTLRGGIGTQAVIKPLNPTIAVQATATGTVAATVVANTSPVGTVVNGGSSTSPGLTILTVAIPTAGTWRLDAELRVSVPGTGYMSAAFYDNGTLIPGSEYFVAAGGVTQTGAAAGQYGGFMSYNLTTTGARTVTVGIWTTTSGQTVDSGDGRNWLRATQIDSIFALNTLATMSVTGNVTTSGNVSATGNVYGTNLTDKTSSSWTVTTGTNTYSITVPANGNYQIWVRANITNGIITYQATVSVTNTNVPVLGTQRAWNYTGGGSPILLTTMPTQIVGAEGTISTAVVATTTANRFDFVINNTSGSSQTVYWGYVTL